MTAQARVKTIFKVVVSFLVIAAIPIYLAKILILSLAQMGLMLVALIGLYVGGGVLIIVYRLVTKLE